MAQPDSDYELITEHLGYPPVTLTPLKALLDDIINTVNVLADRALDSVEQLLLSIPPSKLGFRKPSSKKDAPSGGGAGGAGSSEDEKPEDAARREIESGTHKLETLLTAAIDRNFDKLELYAMQNILTVQPVDLRPHVRLAHYKDLDLSGDDQQDGDSLEGVTALLRRVEASQRLGLSLQREKARNDALLASLRRVVGANAPPTIKTEAVESPPPPGPLAFLNDGPSTLSSVGSATPITTTAEFTLSQLTSLRALSASLRDLMPELTAASLSTDNPSSWRRQRAEYVEHSSRKYLEKISGLELGPQGEVRDGDYQGRGRNLARDDVEGLEKAAGLLGQTARLPPDDHGDDHGDDDGDNDDEVRGES
ncbi:kinetochore protein Mis12/MTW1 [Geosmithia morbida]|uniref:Kinetochore protein Mis12/MTW1 n=1 Tax=Geosmithia morbida TaxID=1094350 RepID=A0A9P5D1Z6_9HYPO|nr:kinetochore protein Mis12/MTW1 [Geosmithia morbida]KAF4120305.1 kinetochore protein Mis12/MTW1 [Geosmithia morbida]